jgi:hypothetical protein
MLTHVRAPYVMYGGACYNTGQWCGSEHVPSVISDGVQKPVTPWDSKRQSSVEDCRQCGGEADTCWLL